MPDWLHALLSIDGLMRWLGYNSPTDRAIYAAIAISFALIVVSFKGSRRGKV